MKRNRLSHTLHLGRIATLAALAFTSAAAVAQTAPVPATHPGLFSQMVVFGDSFSDSGNFALAAGYPQPSRFTTNPGHVMVEDIAGFFGLPLTPSLQGGGNHAFAFASLLDNPPDTPAFVPTLPLQLQAWLDAAGGRADADALYTIAGGANDVFTAFTLVGMGLLTPEQAQASLQAAALAEAGMIDRLGDAGARYVMVFNLPDLGMSPDIVALGPDVAAALSAMTGAFNDALALQLAQADVNIIPVNLYALFHEFAADPARYGLVNVTEPACGVGSLAIDCGPQGSGAAYTWAPGTDTSYLFADFGHPTSGTHAMLAQYAESIVLAPGQMSLLGAAPLSVGEAVRRAMATRGARADADGHEDVRVWASYDHTWQRLQAQPESPGSRNRGDVLSIGAQFQPGAALSAGVVLSGGRQHDAWQGGAGAFDLRELMVSLHAAWRWQQGWIEASVSHGRLAYDDIRRNIVIGPSVRSEFSDTSGKHLALGVGGGWWFEADGWRHGPFADLSWQRVQVDAFAEGGSDATAMTFGRQHVRSLLGTLGWQVLGELQAGSARLQPFARIAWHHDRDAQPIEVGAGLVSMPGTFALPGHARDANWGSARLGLAADLGAGWSGWIDYERRFADSSQHSDSLTLGARLRF